MLLVAIAVGKNGTLSSPQRHQQISGKLVLNHMFFACSAVSILHGILRIDLFCCSDKTDEHGGFLHRGKICCGGA